ncbi:DUF1707 domain-containing protein [Streptomyces sp. YIM 98790]|uniref:DUF1707 SHOCT-like domain-containing protein n=1 Tax=Streptomyces sp. YIM 98790 TaxID=2689077 RepID=UPI0028BDC3E0|nr:DUF1707 domain-containing protein [Streptomyces sp. YIM 98790]
MNAENPPGARLEKQSDSGPTALRASDADRDRVADILREALAQGRLDTEEHAERIDAVYRAKTVAELSGLIGDLPEGQQQRPGGFPRSAAPPPVPPRPVPVARPCRSARVLALLGGAVRRGRWRVGSQISSVAVCGGVELDLTEAIFESPVVTISVVTLCGGVDIKLPENVTVRNSGNGILGGFEVRENEASEPGAPVVVVQGVALLGGVSARPVPGKSVRDLNGDATA